VLPIALSQNPGVLTLYGASGPSASLVKNWAGYSARFKQLVPTSTLDNMLSARAQDEQFLIKIDVEGAEAQVLKGAIAIMRRRTKPAWLKFA
jgi:FkbM family methyltransferase